MIVGTIDLGQSHPVAQPVVGQTTGSIFIEGVGNVHWPRGSVGMHQTVNFTINAWFAIGGSAANTMGAARFLVRQMEELADNPMWQPVYIQWTTTANGAALYSAFEYHDGWYIIENFAPDYGHNIVTSQVKCTMTVSRIAPSLARNAIYWMGAALSSNYSAVNIASNVIELPYGSFAYEGATFRTHASGIACPTIFQPGANPEPFTPSTGAISNWFASGVRVYDTLNTASNPIPASGLYVNANWVEVFSTDHNWVGDMVVTNGLVMFLPTIGSIINAWFWDTATATPAWQGAPNLSFSGVGLRSFTLEKVGPEEAQFFAVWSDGNVIFHGRFRLQRGRYELRIGFKDPLASYAQPYRILAQSFNNPKFTYNSVNLRDPVIDGVDPFSPTDYGYGAIVYQPIAGLLSHAIYGWLTQNQTAGAQPYTNVPGGYTGPGDTVSQPKDAWRDYGFFMVPYGVTGAGAYSTGNLQGEVESFTLSGGFVSAADAGSSGGNSAKLPSGTAVGAIAIAAGWVPQLGNYNLWVRMRVASAAAATVQMQIGFWDGTAATFLGSVSYRPSDLTTSYAWYKVGIITTVVTHSQEFRAISVTNAATTDWWLDEMVLAPITNTQGFGPQDIWLQWMFDRSTKWIRQ